MGLQSAMTTALTGMQASETVIDVIGNNVANSNTVGFKASEVIFATQFLQTQSIGSAPSDTNGGTNPRQVGLGVKVAAITPDFNQGTIEISSNPLDLAIQGDGFLIVQGGQGEALYTRNGQLSLNSENQIVTSTGNKLMGYGLTEGTFNLDTSAPRPLTIPLGGQRVAEATTEATFQGVLNPTVQPGTVPSVTNSETFGDASVVHPAATTGNTFDSDDVTERDAPAAGSAAAAGVGTSVAAGDYSYRVTFLDDNGLESSPSAAFNITLAGSDTIDLSGLPVGPSGWTGGVNIYRADGTGSTDYRLVGNVPNGTTTFNDTTTTAVGVALDTDAIDSGTYTYYVTYYNNTTNRESRPSVALGPTALDDDISSIRIAFDNLEAPSTDYDQIRIYRNTSDNLSTFRLLDTVPAPGATGYVDSYVDTTPSADIAGAPTLDFDGVRASGSTLLTNLQVRNGSTYTTPFEEGTLFFTGEVGGSTVTTQELEITSTTTVQDYIDFMAETLGLQETSNVVGTPLPAPPDYALAGGSIAINNGVIEINSNYGEQNTVSIPLTAFRLVPTSTGIPETVDVSFSETQEANGPGTATEFIVYDSLGSPISVRLTTVLESADSNSTTYRWYATSGGSQPGGDDLSTEIGNGLMVFDSAGNLLSSPSARLSIYRELTASESPLEIELDFSQVTSLAETNSSGEAISSLSMVRQDGFPPGVLTDFIITESGLIQGQFSNGTQRTLGQVLMARFANNKGLQQVGNSLYAASVNSGDPFYSTPGEDGIGQLTAGAVELSNTDIGQDLVKMILAQTQYQAGSRVISTAQQLLDELLALNR